MSSAIFEQVVEATRGEYVLHGTLGHSDALGSAFLAHEVTTGRSVLLVVPPDAESLDVVGALSETIPADAGACGACGFRVGTWTDACPRCEHVLQPPPGPSLDAAVLRDQLRGTLDVIGSLPHVRGGTIYFGQDPSDRRLTAFVARPQADGELALDVIWESVSDAPTRVASVAPVGELATPADVTAGAEYHGQSDVAVQQPPVYERVDAPAPDGPPARRRLLPIGVGVGVLAAVAGVAFALTRRDVPVRVPPPVTDTASTPLNPPLNMPPTGRAVAALPVAGDSIGSGATIRSGTTATPTAATLAANDSIRRFRRHVRDSLHALPVQSAAVLTIEGDLPTGWTRTVNGAQGSSDRDVPLVVGTPTVIRIEAPGYCADTLALTPAPRSHQRWAPTLRGRPTVGEC